MGLKGIRDKARALRLLNKYKNIPKSLKKKFEESPQRKAIEAKVTGFVFDREYSFVERGINNAIVGKKVGWLDAKHFGSWVKCLQKGSGYTKRTRKAIDEELPSLAKRMQQGKLTKKDREDLKKEIFPFLQWMKFQEKFRVLSKKKLF